MQVATHLRPMAATLFCASALFLAARLAAVRMRSEKSAGGDALR
jgi:hypothetical protein